MQDLLSGHAVLSRGILPVHIDLTDERAQTVVYAYAWDRMKKKVLSVFSGVQKTRWS